MYTGPPSGDEMMKMKHKKFTLSEQNLEVDLRLAMSEQRFKRESQRWAFVQRKYEYRRFLRNVS